MISISESPFDTEAGQAIGYDDVLVRLDKCAARCRDVGLGGVYLESPVR